MIGTIFVKFSQLIPTKIKIVATRCQIIRLKCTKFNFGWESLRRSLRPLAGFKGLTSKEREGEGTGESGGR